MAGVCAGLLVALGALFLLTIAGSELHQVGPSPGKSAFFGVWLGLTLLSLGAHDALRVLKLGSLASGILLSSAGLLSLYRGSPSPLVAEVDLSLILAGGLLLGVSLARLRRDQSEACDPPRAGRSSPIGRSSRSRKGLSRLTIRSLTAIFACLLVGVVGGSLLAACSPGPTLDRLVIGAFATLGFTVTSAPLVAMFSSRRSRSISGHPEVVSVPSRRRALFELHSFLGAVLGIFVFVICVTGSLTLFRDELRVWSSPSLRSLGPLSKNEMISLEQALAVFLQRYDLTASSLSAIRLPAAGSPTYELLVQGSKRVIRAHVHPKTGASLGESKHELGDFLFQFHSNLTFRGKPGRYAVGLIGVVTLMLITTGLVLQGRRTRGLVSIRRGGSRRALLSDVHRALGVWGLGFHCGIAFTGAFLALKSMLVLVPIFTIHEGEMKTVLGELSPPSVRRTEAAPATASVDRMLITARAEARAMIPTLVVFRAYGDKKALVEIAGSLPGLLLPKNEGVRIAFDAVSGEIRSVERGNTKSRWHRLEAAMMPLHYADFAGPWLSGLYFVLGLGTSLLALTGVWMWAERRFRAQPP